MHKSKFVFSCLEKTKKERAFLNSIFLFSAERKKQQAFLNSVFLFSAERKKEIRLAKLIFHFLVGQSTIKSVEILSLEIDLLVGRKVHGLTSPGLRFCVRRLWRAADEIVETSNRREKYVPYSLYADLASRIKGCLALLIGQTKMKRTT